MAEPPHTKHRMTPPSSTSSLESINCCFCFPALLPSDTHLSKVVLSVFHKCCDKGYNGRQDTHTFLSEMKSISSERTPKSPLSQNGNPQFTPLSSSKIRIFIARLNQVSKCEQLCSPCHLRKYLSFSQLMMKPPAP